MKLQAPRNLLRGAFLRRHFGKKYRQGEACVTRAERLHKRVESDGRDVVNFDNDNVSKVSIS